VLFSKLYKKLAAYPQARMIKIVPVYSNGTQNGVLQYVKAKGPHIMKFIGQIIDKLGRKPSEPESIDNPARRLLDEGQWAKRGEDYTRALERFNEAERLAEELGDPTSLAVITLHRSDTLIAMQRWADAEAILLRMRHDAQMRSHRAQLTYALSALGTLEQARSNWDEARAYYEQALKVARAAVSMGGEGRAMAHLADTYLEEKNASYAVHLLRDALPKLNLSGDIELSSYFVGQLGNSLILTGHEAEGERLLYRALRIAEQMKYRRFERHWSLALAERASSNMRYEEAQRLYQQALPLFGPETPGKTEALCETSRICLYLGDTRAALDYARQALDAAQNKPNDSALPLAEGVYGMALRANEHSMEAIPYLKQAVESLQHAPDAAPLRLEIMRNLASARAGTGETEAALALYQQVLEITGDALLEKAQTHLEMGLLYEQQRDMQNAIEAWKAALAIYEGEHYYAQVARLYCDIGGARRFLGQGKRAMKEYEQALMMLSSINDWGTRGVVVSNAAIAYAELGDSESAEAFFNESIEIASRLQDRAAEATRRGNYGWFLLSTGRSQRAIITLEQALRISKDEGLKLQVAIQTDNLGLAYDMLSQYEQGLEYHRAAQELICDLNSPHWESMIKINLGNTLMQLKQIEEARPLFRQALDEGRAQADVEAIVRALIGQARLALIDIQPQEADDLLEEAIQLARRADMRRQLAEALQVHSEQQAALNETERSLTLWDEAQKLFTILQMPQADLEPEWLKDQPVET
jgi:tetratricopeptide (TPR) repeat protein